MGGTASFFCVAGLEGPGGTGIVCALVLSEVRGSVCAQRFPSMGFNVSPPIGASVVFTGARARTRNWASAMAAVHWLLVTAGSHTAPRARESSRRRF